jgi:hypothetical protein
VNQALSAGGGVWLQIPGASGTSGNVTEVGEVKQGTTALPIVPGFQIMSLVPPLQTTVKTAMGFPAANTDKIYQFANPGGYTTHQYSLAANIWTSGEPNPKVGEAFWVQRAGAATTWNQTYSVP